MNPTGSLIQGISAITISETKRAALPLYSPQKNDAANVASALKIALLLKTLHDKNLVHRTICHKTVKTYDHGESFILTKSKQEACDDDVKNLSESIDANYDTMPPERMDPAYKGSWLPDDVYALGCFFYPLAFGKELPWANLAKGIKKKEKEHLTADSTNAKILMQTPQLLKDLLPLLSLWMLHPDPKERPTIATVCEKLYNVFPHDLPELSPITSSTTEHKEIILDTSDPDKCAKLALEILGQNYPEKGYAYLPRYESATPKMQIIGSKEKNWILLLPAKSKIDENGTFKIGRRGATVLEKINDIWQAKEYFALSSRKGCSSREAHKAAWAKENWLCEKLGNLNLFPKPYITFTYPQKPHKRLSLYEAFPTCLFDEARKVFTLERAYNLALMLQKLHKEGFANRDLKSENILVAEDGSFIFCDPDSFALDEILKHFRDHIGTEDTKAPERYTLHSGSFFPDDVYALGCLFYEKYINETLPWSTSPPPSFKECYNAKVSLQDKAIHAKTRINSGEFETQVPSPLDRAKNLVYWMLHPSPTERPTLDRVCEELKKLCTARIQK